MHVTPSSEVCSTLRRSYLDFHGYALKNTFRPPFLSIHDKTAPDQSHLGQQLHPQRLCCRLGSQVGSRGFDRCHFAVSRDPLARRRSFRQLIQEWKSTVESLVVQLARGDPTFFFRFESVTGDCVGIATWIVPSGSPLRALCYSSL